MDTALKRWFDVVIMFPTSFQLVAQLAELTTVGEQMKMMKDGFTHCKAMMLPLFNKKEKFCWCKIRQSHLYLWKYDFNPFRAETTTLKMNNLIFESVFYTILGWNF